MLTGNDKSTATENENRCSNSVFQCLTKMKVRIPFFNEGGKRKTKMEVRIPFFNEGGKRKTKMEVRIPFSHVAGKRKTKMEVQIPFSHVAGKRKTKMEVRIPFSHVAGKRKTKMEVQIPFSHVAGKRLALRYTHSILLSRLGDFLFNWGAFRSHIEEKNTLGTRSLLGHQHCFLESI